VFTAPAIDIPFTPAEEQFREEARVWLEANRPRVPRADGELFDRCVSRGST